MSLALEPFLQRDPLSSIQCFLAFKPSNVCPLHECNFLYLCQYSSPGLVSGYFPFIRRYDEKCASFYLMLLAALGPMLPSPTKNKMKHCLIIRFGLICVSIKAICFSFKTQFKESSYLIYIQYFMYSQRFHNNDCAYT